MKEIYINYIYMDFLNKYLKYKNKYLNLKRINQKGGTYFKDGIEMIRIDVDTEYEVSQLKCNLEEKGLIGAEAIRRYKGIPGGKDDSEMKTGKIGVKNFFEAGYTFKELKDGGFNINNFIDSKILTSETSKSAYRLNIEDIQNILSTENNFKKLTDIGFELDDIAKIITEVSDKEYRLGAYENPRPEFIEIYKTVISKGKSNKRILDTALLQIFNINTLKNKFNFNVKDFFNLKIPVEQILEYFNNLNNIIDTYYKFKEIEPCFVELLIETKYKVEKKYTLEQIFEIPKLRKAVQKIYTTRELELTIPVIKELIRKRYYWFDILSKEFSIQELWDIFWENHGDLCSSFKSDTDKIRARIKYKAENNGEEPTAEYLDEIIKATNEKEEKRLEEQYKATIERRRKEEEQEIVNKIKNQIKAYQLKKLKDRGVSIQDIVKNPDNNIKAILMVFTSKEIIDAGLVKFYPELNKLELYNYAESWLDQRFSLFYMSQEDYYHACSFMHAEALPRYLDLINDKLSTDYIIKKWTRPELIKRINMSLEEEYMSKLHPYWEILQRRIHEMGYRTLTPEKWINTATEENMHNYLLEHP